MKYILRNLIKKIFFVLITFSVLVSQSNLHDLYALPMHNYQKGQVIEELRLQIPAELKEQWLEAEKNVWEPWLIKQDGFLGRQIFWDKDNEEALILVSWENKQLWKKISSEEVNKVQTNFENNVKKALNINDNPFKLIYEGELYKQG